MVKVKEGKGEEKRGGKKSELDHGTTPEGLLL